MSDFNRGEVFVIEAELKEYTPFGTHAYADADSTPTITITDRLGNIKVNAQDMTNSTTGKYYYIVETTTSWEIGNYDTTIIMIYNSKTNTNIKRGAFKLD